VETLQTLRIGELDQILLQLMDRHGDDIVRTLLCGESQSVEMIEDDRSRHISSCARSTSEQ